MNILASINIWSNFLKKKVSEKISFNWKLIIIPIGIQEKSLQFHLASLDDEIIGEWFDACLLDVEGAKETGKGN